MKKPMIIGVLIAIGIALVLTPAAFYWHFVRPWQPVVNLDYFYQTKIASASPHDRDPRNNLAQLPAGHQTFDGVRFNSPYGLLHYWLELVKGAHESRKDVDQSAVAAGGDLAGSERIGATGFSV